jgi:probable rRNA maturation factor
MPVRSEIEIQRAAPPQGIPAANSLRAWAATAIGAERAGWSLVIRIVGEHEGRALNAQFRDRDAPTNVLSFPFDAPAEAGVRHLGDLVVCAPVVAREAAEQGKTPRAHWAHLVVHGCLHLLGYDHLTEAEAQVMEARERGILATLGFADPYESTE